MHENKNLRAFQESCDFESWYCEKSASSRIRIADFLSDKLSASKKRIEALTG
jgi:hypothetical protein